QNQGQAPTSSARFSETYQGPCPIFKDPKQTLKNWARTLILPTEEAKVTGHKALFAQHFGLGAIPLMWPATLTRAFPSPASGKQPFLRSPRVTVKTARPSLAPFRRFAPGPPTGLSPRFPAGSRR